MSSSLTEIRGRFRRLAWSAKGEGRRFVIASVDLEKESNDPACPWCKGQNDRNCVCRNESVSVKGDASPEEFIIDLEYRFWGKWGKRNEKYGNEFLFKQLKRDEPHSRVAVVGYLRQFATGIGPVYASQLWDAFGTEAVRVLRTDPSRAANALGIPVAKAKSASDALNHDGANEDLRLELTQLLDGRGFSKKLYEIVIRKWGLSAPDRIRRDPFTLLVHRFPSCGFGRCDRLYTDLGLPLDRLKRQFMCIWRALKENGDGHTWHPISVAEVAVKAGISGIGEEKIDWQRAVRLGTRAGWLRTRKDAEGRWWIAEAKRADNEASVASDMRRLMKVANNGNRELDQCGISSLGEAIDLGSNRENSECVNCTSEGRAQHSGEVESSGNTGLETEHGIRANGLSLRNPSTEKADSLQGSKVDQPSENVVVRKLGVSWPNPDEISGLTAHQREQLRIAFTGPVSILTGDPGTGKTTAASLVLRYMAQQIGSHNIAVCSPTNLAAMRMRSVLESHSVTGIAVGTFHRILAVQRNGRDGDGWGFFFNRQNKLPIKLLLVDEDSMRDIDISASLLEAVPDGCLILFLGDPNQLPPVGHGAPLRDGIAAGLPHGHFTEILRNSGSITKFCEACRAGQKPVPPAFIDLDRKMNWRHVEASKAVDQKLALRSMLQSLGNFEIDSQRVDPIRDCQVIVGLNEKGDIPRQILNPEIQAVLNPLGEQIEGNPFRVNDKVICQDNCKLKLFTDDPDADPDESPDEFVSNGEIGFVRQVRKRFSVVELEGARTVRVPVARGDGDNDSNGSFDLAYAVTFHKSQGSQWPIVFCLSDRAANRLGSRELWNTGGSRPTTLLVTIGELSTIARQCQRVALRDRKTFLKELILNG
jgi:hypothetical protein